MTESERLLDFSCPRVAARVDQHLKLEQLCRLISWPTISEKRLSLTPNRNVRFRLKMPYRDDTTHVIFEALDFIARLAALVPNPRVNISRFHGAFAPKGTVEAIRERVKQSETDMGRLRTAILDGIEAANRRILELGTGSATTLDSAHRCDQIDAPLKA
jgi:hypothetical protein